MKTEFADITGYYDASRAFDPEPVCMTLGEILAGEDPEVQRWPVRNREPRTIINAHKRAMIHERDGGRCRYCGEHGLRLVVDHIIPRSTFEPHQLDIADRSDNLQSACWDCNEKRSNYETPAIKRLGVTARCWYCVNPEHAEGGACENESLPYPVTVPTFCGRCGISNVPTVEGWIL